MQKKSSHILSLIGMLGFLVIFAFPAYADDWQEAQGIPTLVDSGKLLMDGRKIDLWGIKSLAPDQICWEKNMDWCCGKEATLLLEHFIHGHTVHCTIRIHSHDNIPAKGICKRLAYSHEKDLAKFLVRKGYALSDGNAYKQDETYAKRNKIGIWSSRFQTAEDWKNGIQRFVNK